jgi:hypothetical protein
MSDYTDACERCDDNIKACKKQLEIIEDDIDVYQNALTRVLNRKCTWCDGEGETWLGGIYTNCHQCGGKGFKP